MGLVVEAVVPPVKSSSASQVFPFGIGVVGAVRTGVDPHRRGRYLCTAGLREEASKRKKRKKSSPIEGKRKETI